MKRKSAIIIAAAALISLSACGKTAGSEKPAPPRGRRNRLQKQAALHRRLPKQMVQVHLQMLQMLQRRPLSPITTRWTSGTRKTAAAALP